MKTQIISLLIFLISIGGCSSLPQSTNEMEKRANYGAERENMKSDLPLRKRQRVEQIYMGGRKLSSGDWLVESRIQLVVNEPEYIFKDPQIKISEEK